jgi:hypothetical protein
MRYLIFTVEPRRGSIHAKSCLGAKVGCWIKDRSKEEAETVARTFIEGEAWNVLTLDDHQIVSDSTYKDKVEGRCYYEQALIDREVFVFYTFKETISN